MVGGHKIRAALVDLPEIKVVYETAAGEEVYSKIVTNYMKYSQLILAGALVAFQRLEVNLDIIDMKLLDPAREELYKQFKYGNGTIRCYRIGAGFGSTTERICASDVIILTANFTKTANVAIDFIKYAKKVNPESTIVVGGSDATPRYRYYLENGADIVVLGEGERILPRVVSAIEEEKPVDNLSGIAYKVYGSIRCNLRDSLADAVRASDIPMPALYLAKDNRDIKGYTELFDGPAPEAVRTPIGTLETSRGCPNACSFCTTSYLKEPYRYMSTAQIGNVLSYYELYGIRTLILTEDNLLARLNFPGGRQAVMEMFDLLREHGFAWEFGNGLETRKFMDSEGCIDRDLIAKMFYQSISDGRWTGAFRTYVPLESLHEKPEEVYKKLRPYSQELEIIKEIARTEVPIITFGVIISPEDTRETLELTVERCIEIKGVIEDKGVRAYFTPFIYTPLPGTTGLQEVCWLIEV